MKNNVLFFWYSSCETSVEESLILINAIMVFVEMIAVPSPPSTLGISSVFA